MFSLSVEGETAQTNRVWFFAATLNGSVSRIAQGRIQSLERGPSNNSQVSLEGLGGCEASRGIYGGRPVMTKTGWQVHNRWLTRLAKTG